MNTKQQLAWLRAQCLALPEATESDVLGQPSWRVRNKIFVLRAGITGRWSLWLKGAPGTQGMLLDADPAQFFVPPYLGHKGWIGIWLVHDLDPGLTRQLIRESYTLVAPKRLAALLNS